MANYDDQRSAVRPRRSASNISGTLSVPHSVQAGDVAELIPISSDSPLKACPEVHVPVSSENASEREIPFSGASFVSSSPVFAVPAEVESDGAPLGSSPPVMPQNFAPNLFQLATLEFAGSFEALPPPTAAVQEVFDHRRPYEWAAIK